MIDINDDRIPLAIRERAKNATPREQINNTEALALSGLKVVHVREDRFGFPCARPVTIAYKQINKSHYKISTAVCHKSDTFSRKVGTKTAIQNFNKGASIVVPVDSMLGATGQFKSMFGSILD